MNGPFYLFREWLTVDGPFSPVSLERGTLVIRDVEMYIHPFVEYFQGKLRDEIRFGS